MSTRIKLLKDESGHLYAVPVDKVERFEQLLYRMEHDDGSIAENTEWDNVFSPLMLTFHLSCYTFADMKREK